MIEAKGKFQVCLFVPVATSIAGVSTVGGRGDNHHYSWLRQ
jgi:hypothetical protein